MKYQETKDYSFLLDENYFIYDHEENDDELHFYIKSKTHKCCCPSCGIESNSRHATYERTLQDTPIHCKQTFLHVNVFSYDCLNPQCTCGVFSQCLPFAKTSQVRTRQQTAGVLPL